MDKPKITRDQIQRLLDKRGIKDELVLVAIRGWDAHVKGHGSNERGIFDDAMCLIGPHTFSTFNANTDPSSYRKGKGTGAKKGMACLKPGFYHAHQLGLHRGKYMALIQTAAKVTVIRDGTPNYEDTGWFGINIHHGSLDNRHTSSAGCQTIVYNQWKGFIGLVQTEMHQLKHSIMPYLLIEAKELA